MGKTFSDNNGVNHEVTDSLVLEVSEDIVTGEVTEYKVIDNDFDIIYQVSESTYKALEKYLR